MSKTTTVLPTYAPLTAHVVASRLLNNSKHKGMIRGFYRLSEAWYADTLKDRTDGVVENVNIGFFGYDGKAGTTGEFGVDWRDLGGKLHPQLCIFDDAWEALMHFADLLVEMAKLDGTDPTPPEFCELLKRLGIKDLTPRTRP